MRTHARATARRARVRAGGLRAEPLAVLLCGRGAAWRRRHAVRGRL